MNAKLFRQMAVKLLDDDTGISRQAYVLMCDIAHDEKIEFEDIICQVSSTDGRIYLRTQHNVIA